MTSADIRQKFFSFFTSRNHQLVESSSLIPAQDPTLLFTNAGMNQFKDLFLGLEKRSYKRATSIQKCVRAGGKHNDLDNVGFTSRHLTFFEMMGNFSFGDYFKREAINFAWDFLTKEVGISSHNMHATVYLTDDESYDIWHKEIGIPAERMHRLGQKDNFWQMGDVGPCGPCTEIHLDRGAAYGCKDISTCGPSCDCDRFLEIWNLVFMQYDRQLDGNLTPLAQTGVDTGMGLERLCSVVQKVDSVYETDLFTPIIAAIENASGKVYSEQTTLGKAAFHVLADHIRSSSLLIADGCTPSNDGRGYVLRKIIRRAALFAQKITTEQLFPPLVASVVDSLGGIYPELKKAEAHITSLLKNEIEKFATNLTRGQQLLNAYVQQHAHDKIVSGTEAFKLYDTYGFPLELIIIMAHERSFTVDTDGFEVCMTKQKEQSGKKTLDPLDHLALPDDVQTTFTGYQELETTSTISALITGQEVVDMIPTGSHCWVIAEKSPFFIVGGGQVPDEGWLVIEQSKVPIEQVRYINGRIAALVKAPTPMITGMKITSIVDPQWRSNAMKNHTATHLLQAALMAVLGKQIKQAGSLVHPDYLRFDFSYHENLTPEQLQQVEQLVNEKIQQNIPVTISYGSLKQAQEKGALAFFGEKYNPEQVRMVDIPEFSIELCGGTHVQSTGQIGMFKIVEGTALSAGTRRLVAVTGPKALTLFQELAHTVKTLSQEFKVKREDVCQTALKNKENAKALTEQVTSLKQELLKAQIPAWLKEKVTTKKVPFLFINLPDQSHETLRTIATTLVSAQDGLYFLTSVSAGKQIYVAAIDTKSAQTLPLKTVAEWLAKNYQLQGGGSKEMLQGAAQRPIAPDILKDALLTWLNNA